MPGQGLASTYFWRIIIFFFTTQICASATTDKSASPPLLSNAQKCCGPESYPVLETSKDNQVELTCVPIISSYSLKYDHKSLDNETSNGNKLPECGGGRKPRVLENSHGIWFRLSSKDEVTIVEVGLDYFLWAAWLPVENSSYCVDIIDEEAGGLVLAFCSLEPEPLLKFTVQRYIFGVSSLLTILPLLATLLLWAYVGLWRCPRKWLLISYFLSYALASGAHGAQILLSVNSLELEGTLVCKYLNHLFVYFACVFGTSCMFISVDIFLCFWRMNSQLGILNPSKTYLLSCIFFSWGGILALYTLGELWRLYLSGSTVPDLAWKKCVTMNLNAVEFLLMIQFVFKFAIYLSTSALIWKHKKSTSFATQKAQRDFSESKVLYAKLFATTGMPFTCLVLDYCFGESDPMNWAWFLFRFPHSALGPYIFLVFGLSREVRSRWEVKAKKNLRPESLNVNSRQSVDLREMLRKLSRSSTSSYYFSTTSRDSCGSGTPVQVLKCTNNDRSSYSKDVP